MKTIHLSKKIVDKIPSISFGLIEATQIKVNQSDEYFEQELKKLENEIQQKFEHSLPSENEIISATRRMYRSAGWEPTKYRPSSEALVRRFLKGKGLYKINNVVDFANLVSARYHIPLGLYDIEKIKGEIFIDIGEVGEVYQGISKPVIHAEGKLILRDDEGVFGNPTADSLRTSIQSDCSKVLTVFFIGANIQRTYINEMINNLVKYYSLITSRENINFEIT